jgi:hypothetical protein
MSNMVALQLRSMSFRQRLYTEPSTSEPTLSSMQAPALHLVSQVTLLVAVIAQP